MTDVLHPISWSRNRNKAPDAAVVLAQVEIVRALRKADLHHILKGEPGAVGFVVDPAETDVFVEAAQDMLKRASALTGDTSYEVIEWAPNKSTGTAQRATEALRCSLTANRRVFGIAAKSEDVPRFFAQVADAVLVTSPVDTRAIQATFHALTGSVPSSQALASAAGASRAQLGVAIKRGRSVSFAMRTLERMAARQSASPRSTSSADHPALADLHGMGEAGVWGQELAADLDDYRAGRISWADVSRGVLVDGKPGTGKTTFARALAQSCRVPIHIHSLAQWQARGYLNDVLKAMRTAFDEAKRDAPSILFIDEMDSFGDRNEVGNHNGDYWRQVINAFLELLDGAEGREGVIVVGATNFPNKIDPAILRPGRLDRVAEIPLPDAPSRAGILRHHLRDELPGVDLTGVAARLEGASGAVLEQIVRDARRRARTRRRSLELGDLTSSLPPRVRLSEKAFRRACVHEAGHVIVGHLLRHETGKIPIGAAVFREIAADGAGGRTTFELDPGHDRTRQSYMSEITTFLAGLAAERVVLGQIGGGAGGTDQSDLHRATILAAAMETSLGLGESLVYLTSQKSGELLSWIRLDLALRTRVDAILSECMERAIELLESRREAFEAIIKELASAGRTSPGALTSGVRGLET